MPSWVWVLVGLALGLVAVWAYARAHRRRRPVDPALVVRDAAEQRVDQQAYRRLNEVQPYNDPGY